MPLFAVTLLVGSGLLFAVQPMAAKGLLPVLGGAPAVWTACVLFFQASVLAGYAYAHAAARLGVRRHAALHVGLMAAAVLLWPPAVERVAAGVPPADAAPAAWLFGRLAATLGLPLVLVAAGAATLQRWYAALSRPGEPGPRDPYPLYAASNLGSLGALVAYPVLVEPNLGLAAQGRLWGAGFAALAVLTLACAAAVWGSGGRVEPAGPAGASPGWRAWLAWAGLAFVPSSLMLGVTAHLADDLAPVPLLWVVPLALYLLSFVLTFARRPPVSHAAMTRLLPVSVLLLFPALASGVRWALWMPLHLFTFFIAAMVCHGELSRRRPPARSLTAFYLALAAGGAAGGLFNALVAPAVFDRLVEYPLVLVLACLVPAAVGGDVRRVRAGDVAVPAVLFVLIALLVTGAAGAWLEVPGGLAACGLGSLVALTPWRRPLRFGLGAGAALLGCGLAPGHDGRVILRDRDFFGVLRVTQDDLGNDRRLFHGGTLHGWQSLDPARRREPLAYYHPTGPAGPVFEALRARAGNSARVAVVGLGAGALACNAEPGQRWTFYEIDPAVVRVARDPRLFTFLSDCRAGEPAVVLGDARLRLRDAPDRSLDLLVLDAFGSDAIPVHLLTREALALYRSKLDAGGLLLAHLSNRYLDLAPVLGALARDAGWACRVCSDLDVTPAERAAGKLPSIWGVVAPTDAALGPLAADPRWEPPRVAPGEPPWTDDVSDLITHFRLTPPRPARPAE